MEIFKILLDFVKLKKRFVFLVFLLLFAILLLFVFKDNVLIKLDPESKLSQKRNWRYEIFDAAPSYTETKFLVSDSISKNANIVINLPEEINAVQAKTNTVFTPDIDGEWIEAGDNKMIFKPSNSLKVGNYYTVTIKHDEGVIGGDFLVEEDPEILNVFPKANSETHEKSEITILFNRPMVPLSTLDVMAPEGIPVEITPKTQGKFKWIGTRTLKFIPETNLIPSSNYTVKIKSDFKSLDGLGVEGFEHKFITRKLRYDNDLGYRKLIYNEPYIIPFNQNVNLEETKKKISLKNTTTNEDIAFIAEYGKSKKYIQETNSYEEFIDKSKIFIYNEKDKFGRAKFWDFENQYSLVIDGAAPINGDIILNSKKVNRVSISGIIDSIDAESEKSSWVTKDLFDASGKLVITFYEEINLDKSKITNQKLLKTEYGFDCKKDEDGNYISTDLDCEKEINKKKLVFTFDVSQINRDDKLSLNLEEIINANGQKINNKTEVIDVNVIPTFKVLSSAPSNNSASASLSELFLCTNLPISVPAREDIDKSIKSNLSYGKKYWERSILVPKNTTSSYYKCKPGEFQNRINYGLMPESDYKLNIELEDQFNSKINYELSFKTGKMPSSFLNFYHYQKKTVLTTPDKTRFTFATENMEYVDVNICKLSAEDMMKLMYNKPNYYDGPETIKNCIEQSTHKINLEKKYWIKNFFYFDLKDYIGENIGHYLLTFSNPNYKEQYGQYRKVYERVYVNVTNLGIIEKKIDIGRIENTDPGQGIDNLFWVTNLKTTEPINEAEIKIYGSDNNQNLVEKNKLTTNNEGIAKINAEGKSSALIVSRGSDSAILMNKENNLKNGRTAYSAKRMYIYTDRPIYRPSNEVHIKGIYRVGYDNDYEIFNDKKIEVTIRDSRRDEILKEEVEISEFGTFEINTTLKEDAPLGEYSIQTDGGYASFSVEEYVPSAFKVELNNKKEEYISGDDLKLNIDANYYFGAPVSNATVEYSIGSQEYYFDKYNKGSFSFGSNWYYCYWGCSYNDKFVLRNKLTLDKNGKGQIIHNLDIKKLYKDEGDWKSKIFVVYVTVKNENGQSVSSQKSFILHNGENYLGIATDKKFIAPNEDFNIMLKSVDTKGVEIAVNDIDLSINKVSWISAKRKQVDGGYYYQWEEKLDPVIKTKVKTDKNGDYNDVFAVKENGSYKIIATNYDSRGNKISTSYEFYVYGNGPASVKPSNDHNLEIEIDNKELNVGDTAQMIIKSPFDKAKALITLERGRIFDYKIVPINQSLYNYKFQIDEEYIPNIYASVSLISGDPDIKHGSVQFKVNTKEKEINLEIKTNKENYLPGENVELKVKALDSFDRPLETELSLAVADLSVLALKGNHKKNPLVFFYNGFPLTVTTASNLKNILFETDVFTGSKGGGGAEADDLATKKRGIFKDTALWDGSVRTNKNGEATINFTLPDNLTTWQIEALGVTKDTKLGINYSEIMARKEIMLTPLQPRFVVLGDEFALGAKIFNQTDNSQELTVAIDEGDFELLDNQDVKIIIPAKGSDTVYFRVKTPDNYKEKTFSYTLKASNIKYTDEVSKVLSVRKNDTYESTATAGYSKQNENEYLFLPDNIIPDKGGLEINTSATLAVYLSNALNSLINYPYGCSEQIASKLDAIAVIKKGLNIKNVSDKFQLEKIEYNEKEYTIDELVEIGLNKLYKNQRGDGGFSYYPTSIESNFYLTLHVVDTLNNLKNAGYKIEDDRIKRAFSYIQNYLIYNSRYQTSNENFIYAAYILNKISEYGIIRPEIYNRIKSFNFNDKFINEDISSLALVNLSMVLNSSPDLYDLEYRKKVFDNIENRIEIDSRGAFLPSNDSRSWNYYETPIKNTSFLLRALIDADQDNQILDRILRWLLNSRAKDGAWGSTNNTISAVDALVDYLIWQRETESNFKLSINLNQEEIKVTTFEPKNIFDQIRLNLGLGDIEKNKLNKISFEKTNLNNLDNHYYYDLSLKYFLPAESIPPRDEGFAIERNFYSIDDTELLNPINTSEVGDVLKAHIKITVPKSRNFVSIEDFIPAGVELINFNLDTENISSVTGNRNFDYLPETDSNYSYKWYREWTNNRKFYPDFKESHDDRLFLFKERVDEGEYEYDYYVRVLVPGKFQWLPARVQEMYFPENFGRTKGDIFVVNEKND